MAPAKAAAAKKQRLTLAQLAGYDDILTDALIDHAFYWTIVPKNRSTYHPSRGIRDADVAKIIQLEVVVNKDLEAGEKKLLATDGLRRYLNGLRTEREKTDFIQHFRRYLRIYLPDCPWEVSSTNRYTIVTHEACVMARRYIKRNETIKYLSGIQINITPEEEAEITVKKRDFSIVVSSRKKCTSLFMGPARFANHDCRANAKLMTTSHSTIEIVATRPIEVGEEITVTYGDSYFGEDNCECLCRSCEEEQKNGWQSEDGAAAVKVSIEHGEPKEAYALRRRRRDDSICGSSRTSSVTPDMRPRIYKTKPKTRKLDDQEGSIAPSPAPEDTPRGRKRTADAMATPPITPAKKLRLAPPPISSLSPSCLAVASGMGSSSSERSLSTSSREAPDTDVTSPEKESPEPAIQTPIKNPGQLPAKKDGTKSSNSPAMAIVEPVSPQSLDGHASPHSIKVQVPDRTIPRPPQLAAMSIAALLNDPSPIEIRMEFNIPVAPSIEVADEVAPTTASQLKEDAIEVIEILDDPETEAAEEIEAAPAPDEEPKRRKYRKRIFVKQSTPPARMRTPGDYILTPLLLSEPDMAWIQCTNCNDYFVQQNAYFTRSACPRCERHSKLYGYAWPKTEKAGPSDKEERILDHRLIHRFLNCDDERRARGRKPIGGARADTEESEEPERGRRSRRDSHKTGGRNKGNDSDSSSIRRSGRACRVSSRLAEW